MHKWMFLTNHTLILLCIAQDPGMRLREMAGQVGITERAAQRIVAELESGGYISREKSGRRNVYHIFKEQPLRHPLAQSSQVGALIEALGR